MDPLLTVAEVAEICRVHPKTVTRAIARGELRGSRLGAGGALRLRPADVDAWIDSRVTKAPQTTQIPSGAPRRSGRRVQGWLVA